MARTVAGEVWTTGWRRALAAFALAMLAVAPATARELQFEPPPTWVNAVAVPLQAQAASGATGGGSQYLLADRQVRVEAHDRIAYSHFATRAVTGDGVEDVAHVQVSFDPSYETLTLHSISVHRGGHVLSRLDPSKVRLLQREKDLEARIYDGRKTASVLLEDVRIGDVVEYAYTIRGVNPAFRDRSAGGFDLQWKVPLQSLYARLMVPEERPVRVAPRNTRLRPEVRHHDGFVDYVWHADEVAPQDDDNDEPSWYDAYASVRWSEYPDWASVAAWAAPMYRVAPDQGPELQAQVDAIARASADPGERLLATLKFVQREVRYLGIEVGIGSLAPRTPREVFARRFGDCKDKALLTVWMLHAMGIDARPALVNTRLMHTLDDYPPSAGMFDHVVVRARVDDHDYWLDPTRAVQKGTLATLSQAAFGRALVVDEKTTSLALMIASRDVLRRHDVHTVFDATGGRGKPVGMRVTTVYVGESADSMREQLAGDSHDEVQRSFLNFYAGFYPDVAVSKPFTVSDDDAANQLTVVESYTVGDPWKRADADKRYEAYFSSPEIDSQLRTPKRPVRSGPLWLLYPQVVTSVTEIRLHKDWKLDIAPGKVDDPAFSFSYDTSSSGSVVKVVEKLETLADNVPADQVADYVTHVKRARDSLGLQLYMPDVAPAAGGGLNLPVALLGAIMVAGAVWLARRAWRYDPEPRPAPGDAPRGIAGWLLLHALRVVVAPLIIARDFWNSLAPLAPDVWSRLTVAGGAHYSVWWAPTLLLELAANVLMLVFSVLVALLFFRKRSSLPRAWIAFAGVSITLRMLDAWAASAMPEVSNTSTSLAENVTLVRDAVSAALWAWYFVVSARVSATFVERLHPVAQASVAAPASAVAFDAPVLPDEAVAPAT
jgi:transglutaminase-like putative cysteine protease